MHQDIVLLKARLRRTGTVARVVPSDYIGEDATVTIEDVTSCV